MLEEKIERRIGKFFERVAKHPTTTLIEAEVIGSLLVDAFQPIFSWEKGDERRIRLAEKAYARRRLKEIATQKGFPPPPF